ncbi:MAG: dTDP-4-dehydrorhamnose reductase [Hyphomicrobiales bacterium]
MKTLLFGADGQVGYHLQHSLSEIGELISCNRHQVDLYDLDRLRQTIRDTSPDFIVNAAAYTAVDQAEDDIGLAYKINADAVELMALEAKKQNSWLIHYSTDYVFDGKTNTPYKENITPNPINVYGWTKLQGENAVIASNCKHLIFRTSWVYSERKSNFAKTILKLATEKDELKIVSDQIGAPTSADFIAQITADCLVQINKQSHVSHDYSGLYHLTPLGRISWYDFACFLVEEAQKQNFTLMLNKSKIRPISSSEYPTLAKRPPFSLLDNSKIQKTFDLKISDWKYHAQKLVSELKQKEIA